MATAALRHATASLHREVQSRIDLQSPDLNQGRYIRILQAFRATFASLESELTTRCPQRFLDLWAGRRRANRLLDDLAALGVAPDAQLEQAVPASGGLESDGPGPPQSGRLHPNPAPASEREQIAHRLVQSALKSQLVRASRAGFASSQ